MAIKYKNRTIRLWKSNKTSERIGLGINFNKAGNRKEMLQIHNAIKSILDLKYGKGVE